LEGVRQWPEVRAADQSVSILNYSASVTKTDLRKQVFLKTQEG